MTFHDIWNQLLKKSSSLADPQSKVEFTSENLKALLRQVYEQGEKAGRESAPTSDGVSDLLGIFGGRK